jgi:5-formyltetrahydrofolate cyclo-ligase
MSAALDKDRLRREALARRDALDPQVRAGFSSDIAASFEPLTSLPFHAAMREGPVSVFLPIRSEIDTMPIIHALVRHGIAVALPSVQGKDLAFRAWRPGEALVKVKFGLSEPPPSAAVLRPRTMLVPLAAFDRRGDRIGYGAGFYDRAIAAFLRDGQPLTTVGLAFSCQEVEKVPAEPHDRRLDWMLTERACLRTHERD